jgi:hypothetical protein
MVTAVAVGAGVAVGGSVAVGGNEVGVGKMGMGGGSTAVAAVVGSASGDSPDGFEAMRMQPASSKKTARKIAFLPTGFLNQIERHRNKFQIQLVQFLTRIPRIDTN